MRPGHLVLCGGKGRAQAADGARGQQAAKQSEHSSAEPHNSYTPWEKGGIARMRVSGGSVASARLAKLSMIMLTHSIWVRGEGKGGRRARG